MHKARQDLAIAQAGFLSSHGSVDWQRKEKECLHAFVSLASAEVNFLKQKSRNNWLNLGDGTTAFFHKTVKIRNTTNLVKSLKDEHGNTVQDLKQIKQIAVNFYRTLLGTNSHSFSREKADKIFLLIQKKFSSTCIAGM